MAAGHDQLVGPSFPPHQPGTYILFLQLERGSRLTVGRLGEVLFLPGIYGYVGSALGPGGLAARLGRHLSASFASPHWHIDHLRTVAQPVMAWWAEGRERRECVWAQALTQMEGAVLPIRGFGASDCRCPAHLVRFPALPDRERFERIVGGRVRVSRFGARV